MCVFVGLAILREGWDDWKRRGFDKEENERLVQVLTGFCEIHKDEKCEVEELDDLRSSNFGWVRLAWKELIPGDIVKVTQGSLIPADIFILASSEEDSICFVETSSLDGESNLKQKQGIPELSKFAVNLNFDSLISKIIFPPPDNNLYSFDAFIEMKEIKKPVTIQQLLLRSSKLLNTDWVIGFVIFAGEETKIRKNVNSQIRTKISMLEAKLTNRIIFFIFFFVIFLALFSILMSLKWKNEVVWYLPSNSYLSLFFSFVVLYNTMIPISLYFMLETIKLIQAFFINADLEMSDNNINAQARTSSLNEELGQVSFLFCDKTGTLTENKMDIKYFICSGFIIGDRNCNNSDDKNDFASTDKINCIPADIAAAEHSKFIPSVDFEFSEIEKCFDFYEFVESVFLCHTVTPSKTGEIQGMSPDEVALITSGVKYNCSLMSRNNGILTANLFGCVRGFEILAELSFSSNRRRMSLIYRYPNGEIWLHCKGADAVILERLQSTNKSVLTKSMLHVENLASLGLRILLFAKKRIEEEEFMLWKREYDEAQLSLVNRQFHLEAVYDKIELNLQFVGATAIEDKLQDQVPETVDNLRRAGIKVWVLTGDKRETVVNIAKSSGIVKEHWKIVQLSEDIDLSLDAIHKSSSSSSVPHSVLVIDGHEFSVLENHEGNLNKFLDISLKFETVICCRVSPIQKSKVVKYIREFVQLQSINQIEGGSRFGTWIRRKKASIFSLAPITCAIGDGANDIAMLQEAHIGIGITGKEGLQAARASDYSIAQFKYLNRLLFVHGHWSYLRTSKFLLGTFYKCGSFFITQFFFQIFTKFSSTSFYEPWTLALYNLIWTSMCVFLIGIFEKDLSAQVLLAYPEYYQQGSRHLYYNFRVFFKWMAQGLFHGACGFFIPLVLHYNSQLASSDSLYVFGTFTFTSMVLVINIKVFLLESTFFTVFSQVALTLTLICWVLFHLAYSQFFPTFLIGFEVYGMFQLLFSKFEFYFVVALVSWIALLPELVYKAFMIINSPIKGN